MKKNVPAFVIGIGLLCLLVGIGILVLTYYQVVLNELAYIFSRPNPSAHVTAQAAHPQKGDIIPVDDQFGIVIPKIKANSKIIANVDPFNEKAYQWALTRGVAQAKGSSLPYENGSMFLFSHSSVNFYEAVRYNSIFYLLDKLEKEDSVYIFYKGTKYTYSVVGKKFVDAKDVSYIYQKIGHTLFLMTCWPPGTTWKRLLIMANPL